jgi:hypothetical protein
MTLDEADKIIAELNVVFPSKKLSVEEVLRWEENLSTYSYASAREAIRIIERSLKFWPTWADFYEVVTPIHRRELVANQPLAIDTARPCTPEETREHLARIKAILDNMGKKHTE